MTSDEMIERINAYYDETLQDYRLVWRTGSHHQMHYGFHDTDGWFRRWFRFRDAIEDVNRVLADRAGIEAGDRVLDAGCGVGGSTIWLARERGADAVGINVNPDHLARARRAAEDAGVADDVAFLERDFTDTGFDDDAFDVFWVIEAVGHAERTADLVAEAARVLRPGGRFVCSDGFVGAPPEELEGADRWRLETLMEGMVAGEVDTPEEFRATLEDHGFADVAFADQFERVKPSALYMHLASVLAWPGARVLELLGLRSGRQRKNRIAGYHQYPALKEGIVVHGTFSATYPG